MQTGDKSLVPNENFLVHSTATLLACIYAIAAVAKSEDLSEFQDTLSAHGLIPHVLVGPTSVAVIAAELAIAVLLSSSWRRLGFVISSAISSAFLAYSVLRYVERSPDPCSCFGSLFRISPLVSVIVTTLMLLSSLLAARHGAVYGPSPMAITAVISFMILGSGANFNSRIAYFLQPVLEGNAKKLPSTRRAIDQLVYIRNPRGTVVARSSQAVTLTYLLVNESFNPVSIIAKPSCGCILGSWTTATIPAHASLVYTASFVTKASLSTQFIQFLTNDQHSRYLFAFNQLHPSTTP